MVARIKLVLVKRGRFHKLPFPPIECFMGNSDSPALDFLQAERFCPKTACNRKEERSIQKVCLAASGY